MAAITFFTDGGARGNPGPAASGAYSEEVGEFKRYLGKATNNQAEYTAIIIALEAAEQYCKTHPDVTEVKMFMDSELCVKQLNREYKVKDPTLQQLFLRVWNLTLKFKRVTFTHVRREFNKQADRLVNEAIDQALHEALTQQH